MESSFDYEELQEEVLHKSFLLRETCFVNAESWIIARLVFFWRFSKTNADRHISLFFFLKEIIYGESLNLKKKFRFDVLIYLFKDLQERFPNVRYFSAIKSNHLFVGKILWLRLLKRCSILSLFSPQLSDVSILIFKDWLNYCLHSHLR